MGCEESSSAVRWAVWWAMLSVIGICRPDCPCPARCRLPSALPPRSPAPAQTSPSLGPVHTP